MQTGRATKAWIAATCAVAVVTTLTLLSAQKFDPNQPVEIHNGFGSGQSFLETFGPTEQRAYAMGVVNGMMLGPMFGAQKSEMQWFERCVEDMTDAQVAAIIAKHLRDNPQRWHNGLHIESWAAFKAACGKK